MILNFRLGSIVYKLYQSTFLPTHPPISLRPAVPDQLPSPLPPPPLTSPVGEGKSSPLPPFYWEKVTALPWQWGANPGVGAPPVRFRGLLQRPSALLCVQRLPEAGALRGISLQFSNLALFPFYPASGHSFWGHTGASGRHAPYSSPPHPCRAGGWGSGRSVRGSTVGWADSSPRLGPELGRVARWGSGTRVRATAAPRVGRERGDPSGRRAAAEGTAGGAEEPARPAAAAAAAAEPGSGGGARAARLAPARGGGSRGLGQPARRAP